MKSGARPIFCATDFSPNAASAMEVAAGMARRLRRPLVLAHVAEQAATFGESTKDFRLALRRARSRLQKEAARVSQPGLEVHVVVLADRRAGMACARYLAEHPAWLAVVAAQGRNALARWRLGSVSEYLAQHSLAPILIVRKPDPLRAWVEQRQALRVVVGVDFSVSADAALSFVAEFGQLGACKIALAHSSWPPDARQWTPRRGLGSGTLRTRRGLLRELRRKAAEYFREPVGVHVAPGCARPAAALLQYADQAGSDLVVVGTHQYRGLGRLRHTSISREVLRHARRSVLCVPVPDALAHGVGRHPRLQRVMAATDLSAPADQAIPWAYAVAAREGVVQLVHVIEPRPVPSPLVPRYDRSSGQHHARRAAARRHLLALVPGEAAACGVQTQVEVVADADAAHGVAMAARRFGPDLLCVACDPRRSRSMGRGGMLRRLMAQCRRPVLVVPPAPP